MNRNRYRLVFDKRTNTLIPVAEFTAAAKKGGGGGFGDGMGDASTPRWSRLCASLALACWGGLGVPLTLQAQTVPDPSSGMTVSTTANGTELVNIVNPDLSGNAVYGDKGVYLSNTLSTTFVGGVQGFVGLDVGMVSDNVHNVDRDIISGWAAGVRGNWRFGNISLTWAEPIRTAEPGSGDAVLYATATLRL